MKQEDLLLIDLCSRLYYKVKVSLIYNNEEYRGTLCAIYPEDNRVIIDDLNKSCHYYNQTCGGFLIDENKVKPYLFPLSSMTEEQLNDFYATIRPVIEEALDSWKNDKTEYEGERPITLQDIKSDIVAVNWMLKNHFDMNGLIPKGLAIDATGLNIY